MKVITYKKGDYSPVRGKKGATLCAVRAVQIADSGESVTVIAYTETQQRVMSEVLEEYLRDFPGILSRIKVVLPDEVSEKPVVIRH